MLVVLGDAVSQFFGHSSVGTNLSAVYTAVSVPVRVERALSLGRIKATTTYEERMVDVTPELVYSLRQHLAWIRGEALKQGTRETNLALSEEGKPHDESGVRKAFKRALKDAKLPAFRLYDLRHTYASLLLAERAPITYVAERLGHANPSTTLRYHARWIPSKGQRWADGRVVTTSVRKAMTTAAAGVAGAVGSLLGIKSRNQNENEGSCEREPSISLVGRQGLEPWTR